MSAERRRLTRELVRQHPPTRLKRVIAAVSWASSSFFRRPKASKKRPGPAPRPFDPIKAEAVREMALAYPWWGYKRIAVICRRAEISVSNRFVYRVLKAANLLQRRRPKSPELYQAARLFELLPQKPNDCFGSAET